MAIWSLESVGGPLWLMVYWGLAYRSLNYFRINLNSNIYYFSLFPTPNNYCLSPPDRPHGERAVCGLGGVVRRATDGHRVEGQLAHPLATGRLPRPGRQAGGGTAAAGGGRRRSGTG